MVVENFFNIEIFKSTYLLKVVLKYFNVVFFHNPVENVDKSTEIPIYNWVKKAWALLFPSMFVYFDKARSHAYYAPIEYLCNQFCPNFCPKSVSTSELLRITKKALDCLENPPCESTWF